MGLDTSHGCWHGAYSSFAAWRNAIADAARIGTKPSDHLPGASVADIDFDAYEWCNFQGMWQESPSDPLLVLLVHSDCDGYIFPQDAESLADRLEGLLPRLSDDEFGGWRNKTQEFIDGLRAAAKEWEIVVFH